MPGYPLPHKLNPYRIFIAKTTLYHILTIRTVSTTPLTTYEQTPHTPREALKNAYAPQPYTHTHCPCTSNHLFPDLPPNLNYHTQKTDLHRPNPIQIPISNAKTQAPKTGTPTGTHALNSAPSTSPSIRLNQYISTHSIKLHPAHLRIPDFTTLLPQPASPAPDKPDLNTLPIGLLTDWTQTRTAPEGAHAQPQKTQRCDKNHCNHTAKRMITAPLSPNTPPATQLCLLNPTTQHTHKNAAYIQETNA